MRSDFPRLSVTDRRRYMAMWREENREELREYNRNYGKKRRAEQKRALIAWRRSQKNGSKTA